MAECRVCRNDTARNPFDCACCAEEDLRVTKHENKKLLERANRAEAQIGKYQGRIERLQNEISSLATPDLPVNVEVPEGEITINEDPEPVTDAAEVPGEPNGLGD